MKSQMTKLKMTPVAMTLLALGLGGCAATQEANKNFEAAHTETANTFNDTKVKSTVGINNPQRDAMSNFGRAAQNWVNPKPLPKLVPNENRSNLPQFFNKNVSLTIPGRVSMVEVVSEIQRANGIPFDISGDVYNSTSTGGQGKILTATGGGSTSEAKGKSPLYITDFVYHGSLEGALDLLSAKSGVSWKWTGSNIKIFRFETKTYTVAALPGDLKNNSSVTMQSADTSGSGGGSSGGSTASNASNTQGVNRTSNVTKWNEIRAYLLSLLSPDGTLAVMESTGLVTVNDTPAVQALVSKAVNDLNGVISKQIYINVDVYAIDTNSADNNGIDWSLAWGAANSKFNIGYSNAGNTASTGNFNIGLISGPFSGSKVMLNALSTLGRASIMNQFALTTLNGEPTPVSSNKSTAYVQSIKVTPSTTQGVAPTTEVDTSNVFSGIGLTVTPEVQSNGKILLEYSMNLNDVQDIPNFTTGSGDNQQTIQLPITTIKSILQRAVLRSGQTLVLSGFKQVVAKNDNAGVASPSNILFGGKQNASNEEQYLVITITPYIAQDNE